MASITLKNVVKRFDDTTVIPGLDLTINDREFMILVGPSGCGKSTTLRMIAGLESVTEGELFIGDRCVNKVPPKDRDIAMVFQSYALYPHMTVYKNMAFGLMLRKVPRDEIDRKVREAARTLDIEKYLNRKPRALSGGQRQRVALGRAMVRNPHVFLLDEPLSNLDAKLRTEMRSQLIELHRTLKTTFVYVTHDQTEAMTMADRIAVMKNGLLLQVDTPHNLYYNPKNIFVAGFIGSPQMNFTDAVLQKETGIYYLYLDSERFPLRSENSDSGKNTSLDAYIGKKVVFGIRPDDIRAEENFVSSHPESAFEADITYSEMTGSEAFLHFIKNGVRQICKTPSRLGITEGKVKLAYDMNKAFIFDKETEENIL